MTESNKASNDVLAHLRSATRALHTQLDTGLPLAKNNATLADYGTHLRLVHAWLKQISASLEAYDDAPAHFGAESNRTSTALLVRDLAHAGLAPARPTAVATAVATALATSVASVHGLAQPAFRWGMQYVIEGSYMGAGFLHRRYAAVFADSPMFFFSHVGAASQTRWPAFGRAMRAAVTDAADIDLAAQGACYAFHCFMQLTPATADHTQTEDGHELARHHA